MDIKSDIIAALSKLSANIGKLIIGMGILFSGATHAAIWNCSEPATYDCDSVNFGSVTLDYEQGTSIIVDEVPTTVDPVIVSETHPDNSRYTPTAHLITSSSGSFGTWGSSSANYTGSRAIFSNAEYGTTTITGQSYEFSNIGSYLAFDLESIDVSELLNTTTYSGTQITFYAQSWNGYTVTQVVTLDGIFGNETIFFDSSFTNLKSVSWNQTPGWHQFDNVVLSNVTLATPIPPTIWLFLSGITAIAGFFRNTRKPGIK